MSYTPPHPHKWPTVLGQLGEVGSKVKFCGKLLKLSSGKFRQGTILVVQEIAVRIRNSTDNAVNALEEMKMSEQERLVKKD